MVYVIVSATLFLDQLTKYLATKTLALHQPVPFIPGVVYLTLVHNRGAAFGILKNQLPLFIITSVLAIALMYGNLRRSRAKAITPATAALSFILAGALGNLIDRVRVGYVIDFIDVRFWPVFNIADSAITVGAVVLGYTALFIDGSARAARRTGPPKGAA